MKDKGFITMPAIYPAITRGDEGLRITITRHISKDDIDDFLKTLKKLI